MSHSSKIYAYFISVVGLSLGSYCTYVYIKSIFACANPTAELIQFGVLWALYIVCRCFPIYIRDDYAIDMSFICNLATILCKGPITAVTMILISTPFVIVQSSTDPKVYCHIFNTEPIKTAFNTTNYVISVSIAGFLYVLTGVQSDSLHCQTLLFRVL